MQLQNQVTDDKFIHKFELGDVQMNHLLPATSQLYNTVPI